MKCEVCDESTSINWGNNSVTLCESHSEMADELTDAKKKANVALTDQSDSCVDAVASKSQEPRNTSKPKMFFYLGFVFGALLASYQVFITPDIPAIGIIILLVTVLLMALIPLLGYYIGLKLNGPGIDTRKLNFLAGFVVWQCFNSIDFIGFDADEQWYVAYVLAFVLSMLSTWQPFRLRKLASN